MNPPPVDISPGAVLAKKYLVERTLGKGGMGIVIAAIHIELHERRALKLMLPEYLGSEVAVERFIREACATVHLHSDHIARVFDVDRLECGAPYIAMEFLEGVDLAEYVRKRGPLPIEKVALFVSQACKALARAHAKGIVHRDVKPANLFLTTSPHGSDCVKVLDFGISKQRVINGRELKQLTEREILGSPAFMSPEQARSSKDVDGRADVWSLGAVLYKLVTDRTPYQGLSAMELLGVYTDRMPCDPPSKHRPDLDPGLERIILRCLDHNLATRMPSAADLEIALRPFLPSEEPTLLGKPALRGCGPDTRQSALDPSTLHDLRRDVDNAQREHQPTPRHFNTIIRMPNARRDSHLHVQMFMRLEMNTSMVGIGSGDYEMLPHQLLANSPTIRPWALSLILAMAAGSSLMFVGAAVLFARTWVQGETTVGTPPPSNRISKPLMALSASVSPSAPPAVQSSAPPAVGPTQSASTSRLSKRRLGCLRRW